MRLIQRSAIDAAGDENKAGNTRGSACERGRTPLSQPPPSLFTRFLLRGVGPCTQLSGKAGGGYPSTMSQNTSHTTLRDAEVGRVRVGMEYIVKFLQETTGRQGVRSRTRRTKPQLAHLADVSALPYQTWAQTRQALANREHVDRLSVTLGRRRCDGRQWDRRAQLGGRDAVARRAGRSQRPHLLGCSPRPCWQYWRHNGPPPKSRNVVGQMAPELCQQPRPSWRERMQVTWHSRLVLLAGGPSSGFPHYGPSIRPAPRVSF